MVKISQKFTVWLDICKVLCYNIRNNKFSEYKDMNKIKEEIQKLKKEKDALLLAHYYTPDSIQEIADEVGDSYYLAKVAKKAPNKTVVFCGVQFMGESVKLLNPDKTVLMPDITADCPMAHDADIEKIEQIRQQYDDLAVVCYINSTVALKCHSDVCVTSSNAVKIVSALPNKNIYFIPDKNLGSYVAKKVPQKNIILNDGCCPIHASISADEVIRAKEKHKNALVLAHPECNGDVLNLCDYIGSTAEMLSFAQRSDEKEFIICTEEGIGYPLKKGNSDKKFYFIRENFCCPDMKLNTLEKVLYVLQTGENEVFVDEQTAKRAMLPLDKMLTIAK